MQSQPTTTAIIATKLTSPGHGPISWHPTSHLPMNENCDGMHSMQRAPVKPGEHRKPSPPMQFSHAWNTGGSAAGSSVPGGSEIWRTLELIGAIEVLNTVLLEVLLSTRSIRAADGPQYFGKG